MKTKKSHWLTLIALVVTFSFNIKAQDYGIGKLNKNQACTLRVDQPMMVKLSNLEISDTGVFVTVNEIVVVNEDWFVNQYGLDSLNKLVLQNTILKEEKKISIYTQNEYSFYISEPLDINNKVYAFDSDKEELKEILNSYLGNKTTFRIYYFAGRITEIESRL